MTTGWNSRIVESSSKDSAEDEPLGTKEKFWVTPPDEDDTWLFKYARLNSEQEVLGEDWAEWLVHQLGVAMGIPTATVVPATCSGRRGVLSKNIVPLTGRLVHGNSLLGHIDSSYETTNGRENPGYTVDAVHRALEGVTAPESALAASGLDAFDVWAGYLVLDALVAGRDRHHENWGIVTSKGSRFLAPSYDHGNALGFQEKDEKRRRCLDVPDQMRSWVERGRSPHFAGKPSLVTLAHRATQQSSFEANTRWRRAIQELSIDLVRDLTQQVPGDVMSDVTRSFVVELVSRNQRRLINDYPTA